MTGKGTRQRSRIAAPWYRGQVVLGAAAVVLAAIALFFCYLRVAGATHVNSDGAGLVLEASDMLHGNLLLHGWWTTDVSFITTELPEYMAVTAAAGIHPAVVHACAALTYTLLVLLAAFVARGRARGTEGVVRALLAAGVVLAPQPTGPTPVLLGSPDHVGTAVPLLALLLLVDRAQDARSLARWLVPPGVLALLALTVVGDPLAVLVGVIPLALACLLLAGRIAARNWRAAWYEVSLAAAAVLAVPTAHVVNSLIAEHGGYRLATASYHWMAWHQVVKNAPQVWPSVLALFGADYAGVTGAGNVAFALVHLTGVALVIAAVAFAAWRLLRPPSTAPRGDLVANVLVLAVVGNLMAYLVYVKVDNIFSAHEIGPVMGLGAALTGRMLGGPLLRARPGRGTRVPVLVLAAWLACYCALLGVAAAAPSQRPQNLALAGWLRQHHLRSGLAPYWEAASVAVDSDGAITMLAVRDHGRHTRVGPYSWENNGQLADPATHYANFVVLASGWGQNLSHKIAVKTFGKPDRTYRFGPYTILVWARNLLGKLGPPLTAA